jgi:hypothetical protein
MIALMVGLLCFVSNVAAEGAGEQISPQMASTVLPYAVLSQDAYNSTSNFGEFSNLASGWERIDDWKTVLARHNYSAAFIADAERAGFYAAVYRNTLTGEVAVAYRGNDLTADAIPAGGANRPGVADAAAQVAKFVQEGSPTSRVTLTGHSLGAYWAMYASMKSGIFSVYLFSPARGSGLGNYNNPNQITTVVSGARTGDSNTGGDGRSLPGKLYAVDSFSGSPGVAGDTRSHVMDGMIWGLTLQALKAPIQSVQQSSPNPDSERVIKDADAPASAEAAAKRDTLPPAPPTDDRSASAEPPADGIWSADDFLRFVAKEPSRSRAHRERAARALRDKSSAHRRIAAIGLGLDPAALRQVRSSHKGTAATPRAGARLDGATLLAIAHLRAVASDPKRSREERRAAAAALRNGSGAFQQTAAIGLGMDPASLRRAGTTSVASASISGDSQRPYLGIGQQAIDRAYASAQTNTAQNRTYPAALYQPAPIRAAYQPGGISLNRAAAERMALGIDIDAIAYRDGRLVITGPQNNKTKLDAALFLTAVRLACGAGDPSFSLDPVDGLAWKEQSEAAMDLAWKQIQDKVTPGLRGQFDVQTFSVRRDFAPLWAEISRKYPELRTRLVFRPEWLSQTRFGEILYKADVLLKELTVGVPIVVPGGETRAASVPGYIAPYKRGAARGLLEPDRLSKRGWQGHRLWFDLMPDAGPGGASAYEDPDAKIDRRSNPALYAMLKARGYVDAPKPEPVQKSTFYVSGGVADLSGVYPKMFILRHDHATGQDIPGANPDLDLLSADVNKRTEAYANAYQELRDLIDIFRAYIASTKIVKEDQQVCNTVPRELASGEKVASALPQFHPSELFVTIASTDGGRRYFTNNSVTGGISLRGKQYYDAAVVERETPLIAEIKQYLGAGPAPPSQSQWPETPLIAEVEPDVGTGPAAASKSESPDTPSNAGTKRDVGTGPAAASKSESPATPFNAEKKLDLGAGPPAGAAKSESGRQYLSLRVGEASRRVPIVAAAAE